MNKVVLYARSSAHQRSPERQLQDLRSALGPEDTVVASFADRANGSGNPRPGLQAALDYLKHHQVDALVVRGLGRLCSDPLELPALLIPLMMRGVTVRTIAGSPGNC